MRKEKEAAALGADEEPAKRIKKKKMRKIRKGEKKVDGTATIAVHVAEGVTEKQPKKKKKSRESVTVEDVAVNGNATKTSKKKTSKKKKQDSKGGKVKDKRRNKEKAIPAAAVSVEGGKPADEGTKDGKTRRPSHKRKKHDKSEDGAASAKKAKKKKVKASSTETLPEMPPTDDHQNLPEQETEENSKGQDLKTETETAALVDVREERSEKSLGRSFRRVADEEWLGKRGASDNSYEATFGSNGWGAKAQKILATVRGKNFRHEKTKKKRGTYFGGKISAHAVNSIKFESDED